jgi:signal transduction histidine kinase
MHHEMQMTQPPGRGLLQWLSGYGYAPHSGCFLGDRTWVTAYVAANWVIALAYILIAVLIAQRMRRASHIPRSVMGIALLGIFVTCGGGHFLEGLTTVVWPGYRLETLWHWGTAIPAWLFLANHKRFSLIVEGPHMIAETREELVRKNGELSLLYEQIKQLDALKSQFFANISHELRTPLTLILGPVERMLHEDTLTDAQRHDLDIVARNARTVLKDINDLLDISKMEAGKMKMHYAETDFSVLTRIAAANFDPVVEERELTFAIETPATLKVQVDPEKMQRVLLNLFSNAVKFVPDGGTIRCTLLSQHDRLQLTVEDTGPGVPREMRTAIFERFRQVEGDSTRRFGGTGLGLAIVKDFVELHRGHIYVGEASGGGARFVVDMPINAPAGVQVEAEASMTVSDETMQATMEELMDDLMEGSRASSGSKGQVYESGKPLVLVVEDNRDMSDFIVDTLTQDYRVETAYDGLEGLERALELRPDLILSDIMMPRKSGDEMVYDLRWHTEMDSTPIMLLTAKADDEMRIRLLERGAQDYLMKPFATRELRARVANQVTMKRARQVLQKELASSMQDVALLAQGLALRNHALKTALEEARIARDLAEQATLREQIRNQQLIQVIREAHHRIKNNLQAVTTLLEMQISDGIERIPLTAVRQSLRQIKAIALVHDLLSQDKPIGEVDVATVLQRLAELLRKSLDSGFRALGLRVTAESVLLPTKVATSLSLVVTELVTNAANYSDVRREGTSSGNGEVIFIDLHRAENHLVLTVEDPGPGFPEGFDPLRHAHMGLELVMTLVASDLQGEITFGNIRDESAPNRYRGRVEIVFPEQPAAA